MRRLWIVAGMVAASVFIAPGAVGQVTTSQSVVSDTSVMTPAPEASAAPTAASSSAVASYSAVAPGESASITLVPESSAVAPAADSPAEATPSTPSIEVVRTAPDAPEVVVDPASLLPDLPKLPNEKASLIGGTIGRLDRVRDQMTVHVFGGGKMKIAFDPRSHIFHDGAEATLADLRQGDRVYVETILDGSTVFARTIRVKSTGAAGESQGIITGYRADKGELQLRDALSPHTITISVNSQTRIVEGDHNVSSTKLSPGTLVAVKFGPRKDGGQVAREVSVLATPGASFTFAGQVTAIDLRLGLLVLTSSTDHKTYEIYLDPAAPGVDDNLRPSANVTVLARFQDNRYVARSISVDAQSHP
jgi:hypothetical protein